MASQHCPIKNGVRGNGAKHALYIAGEGPYADRDDVFYLEDGNLPAWAENAEMFFSAADECERGDYTRKCKTRDGEEYTKTIKGRAYKELEVAVPREAPDPVQWAKNFARDSIGDRHPYRLAVHDKPAADGGRNVHMHLMFSTRTMDGHHRDKETFFKRSAAPYRDRKTKQLVQRDPSKGGAKKSAYWDSQGAIHDHRNRFECHVQSVAPEFKMQRSEAPEQKIGPKVDKAGFEYERQRTQRLQNVCELRGAKRERRDIDAEIKREKEIEFRLTQAKSAGEAERSLAIPTSVIDLGTDVEAAKREQLKPKNKTDELFAQLESKSTDRARQNEKDSPLADFLRARSGQRVEMRHKPIEPAGKPEVSKGQMILEQGAQPTSEKLLAIQQPQQMEREQDNTEKGQQVQQAPRRTDELFARIEREKRERDERDRDPGPEMDR